MFHQESEQPLSTERDFFGDAYSVNEELTRVYLFYRHTDGFLHKKEIAIKFANRTRMCEEYDYGGLHNEDPHLPCFYEKGRYNKAALQVSIEKSEAKYGNN